MMEPAPPANVREAAEGLCYRDFLTVGILLDRLHVLEKGKQPQTSVRDNWIYSLPNLFCIGRNGMHRYNNQDHSMLTAMMAVDNIAAGREDDAAIWDVNMEMAYGEGGG